MVSSIKTKYEPLGILPDGSLALQLVVDIKVKLIEPVKFINISSICIKNKT